MEEVRRFELSEEIEAIGKVVVNAAFKVHKELGPGLLEKVYEICLAHQIQKDGVSVTRQVNVPIVFDGLNFEEGLRIDLVAGEKVIVEVKAVDTVNPVWEAQVISYLKMTGMQLGFVINFHVPLIKNGIKRLINKEIITQQYPDVKQELPERFRGEVVMIHDEKNEHRCTGCTACELACPNATIKIVTKMDLQPDGKKKKALDNFVYHLELCTMCNLCIEACPTGAIKMAQTFEHSVFDRNQLTKKLNAPGSKLMEGVE